MGMNLEVMPWLKQPWGIAAATVFIFFGHSAGGFTLREGHDRP